MAAAGVPGRYAVAHSHQHSRWPGRVDATLAFDGVSIVLRRTAPGRRCLLQAGAGAQHCAAGLWAPDAAPLRAAVVLVVASALAATSW